MNARRRPFVRTAACAASVLLAVWAATASGSTGWTLGRDDQLPSYTATCKVTPAVSRGTISRSCHDPHGVTIRRTIAHAAGSTTPTTQPVEAAPTKGVVLVKDPHTQMFVPLTKATAVPVGATIDVVRGWVRLGTGAASAQFYRGEFTLGRRYGGVTTLTLSGGATCPSQAASAGAKHAPAKPLHQRKLWGTGHGNFTTVGSFASASVIGTHWLTEDTCSGTLIHVASGEVRVTDLVKHRSFVLSAPGNYLAHR